MSVFSTGMNHRSFLWQITSLCFVLGLLMAAAWQTASQINHNGGATNRAGFVYGSDVQVAAKKAAEYEKEINKLNGDNNRLMKGQNAESEKNKKLSEYRVFAGLTEVAGPGVQVTLVDSTRRNAFNDPLSLASIVHDVDIAQVVNELKASGAEAIAVNGERIIGISSIRCVGPVVHVNNVPAAPPFIIQAIGDPNAIFGGINLPNGVLDKLRQFDPNMGKVEKKNKLVLPAFAGGTQMRFAHEVKPVEDSSAGHSEVNRSDKTRSGDTRSNGTHSNNSRADKTHANDSSPGDAPSNDAPSGDAHSDSSENAGGDAK